MKRALVVAFLTLVVSAGAMAMDDLACLASNADITLDATYVTKYLWRGYDLYDDKAAFQPSINVDLNNGWYFGVWYSVAGASGAVDAEEFDYYVGYANSFCLAQQYQVDYSIDYLYYDYPDAPSIRNHVSNDTQEVNIDLAMPNLFACGLTPRYEYAYLWAGRGGNMSSLGGDGHGFVHTIGLQYDLVTCGFLPCNDTQVFNITWDVVYNDGAYNADHDWSHQTFGISTPIQVGCGTLTPALYYQDSWDDSVNKEEELYAGVSYTFNF